jgi:hypothetical protein
MQEATNLVMAQSAVAQPVVSEIVEEVSFKVEKMEDKPVVISNHFAGDVTASTQYSPLSKATNAQFGQLLMNFYKSFGSLTETQKKRGPAFGMIFAALCFVAPTPAFAATAAASVASLAPVVAQSAMKKLMRSVLLAGMAAVITVTFIHPIDVVKTRMQVAPKGEGSLG